MNNFLKKLILKNMKHIIAYMFNSCVLLDNWLISLMEMQFLYFRINTIKWYKRKNTLDSIYNINSSKKKKYIKCKL